jgi:hypothetical protein
MLLPLLMKEEILNNDFLAPSVHSALVGAALESIARQLRQHGDTSLSSVLETQQISTSPSTKENASVVLTLEARGVKLEAGRTHSCKFSQGSSRVEQKTHQKQHPALGNAKQVHSCLCSHPIIKTGLCGNEAECSENERAS